MGVQFVNAPKDSVLPDGLPALGHPTNEDLFAETPVQAVTS